MCVACLFTRAEFYWFIERLVLFVLQTRDFCIPNYGHFFCCTKSIYIGYFAGNWGRYVLEHRPDMRIMLMARFKPYWHACMFRDSEYARVTMFPDHKDVLFRLVSQREKARLNLSEIGTQDKKDPSLYRVKRTDASRIINAPSVDDLVKAVQIQNTPRSCKILAILADTIEDGGTVVVITRTPSDEDIEYFIRWTNGNLIIRVSSAFGCQSTLAEVRRTYVDAWNKIQWMLHAPGRLGPEIDIETVDRDGLTVPLEETAGFMKQLMRDLVGVGTQMEISYHP